MRNFNINLFNFFSFKLFLRITKMCKKNQRTKSYLTWNNFIEQNNSRKLANYAASRLPSDLSQHLPLSFQ